MSLLEDTRTIGEYRYRVTQLPTKRSRSLLVRLTKALGPVLSTLLENLASVGRAGLVRLDSALIGPAIGEFAQRLEEADLTFVCETLGQCTQVIAPDGRTLTLDDKLQDEHFRGRLLDMFKWIAFALEVNYADFLSAAKSAQVAASTRPASSAIQSPTSSATNGTFGESSAPSGA